MFFTLFALLAGTAVMIIGELGAPCPPGRLPLPPRPHSNSRSCVSQPTM